MKTTDFLDAYPLILGSILFFLAALLVPKNGKTYDVVKFKLVLFPAWFKYVSAVWIFITLLLTYFVFRHTDKWGYFLVVNLNFSFFILFFSKDKGEDEFSEQLRLKSFFYAFIGLVPSLIIFGALNGTSFLPPNFFGECIFVQILLAIVLIMALIYFYFTKYKSSF